MNAPSFIDRPFGLPIAVELRLPIPPSVNAMYANSKWGKGRGRFKTKAYREWLDAADALYLAQGGPRRIGELRGKFKVTIKLPASTRGDTDNRHKAILDYLVSRAITDDDKHCMGVSIERADVEECHVRVERARVTP